MFRKLSASTWALCLSALAALGLGTWGWLDQTDTLGLGDAFYRAIGTLLLSDTYQSSALWDGDWRVSAARWLGAVAFVLAAAKAITALLAEEFQRLKARFRRGHLMVVGDDAFAGALAHAALSEGRVVTWLAASEEQAAQRAGRLLVLDGGWSAAQAERYGIRRAASAAIATRDDAEAIAVARQIRRLQPDEKALKVFAAFRAPWLAMRIDDVEGLAGIRLFSRARAAARQAHRRHPPFLIAQKLGHRRIHAVIVGLGQHGEAVLIDAVLSCLTSYLDKPRFTIVDPRADALQSSLALRYPELGDSAELRFVRGAVDATDACLSHAELIGIGADDPVTLVYVCLPDEAASLAVGLAVQALARHHDWTAGPVLARLSTAGVLPAAPAGVSALAPAQLIGFGDLSQLAADTGVLARDPDGLAKAFHAAYVAAAPQDKVTNVPWEALPEDKRDANRRLVIHIAAKLSSAGVDIEPWLKSLDDQPGRASLPTVQGRPLDGSAAERLAMLEHERWMADRRVNGWRHGPQRDDVRRLHPDLVPYDRLNPQSQRFDRLMIETLARMLHPDTSG